MWSFIFIFTFVVFAIMLLVSLADRGKRRHRVIANSLMFLALVIFIMFLGSRYDIGRDFVNYWRDYYSFSSRDYGLGTRFQLEYANYAILYIGHTWGLGPQSYFVITSILTGCLFFSLFKNRLYLMPYAVFIFFLCGPYPFAINAIRQTLAVLCLYKAVSAYKGKNNYSLTTFFVWLFIGVLFHTSTIAFIPVALLFNSKILNLFDSKILIAIVILGFIGGYIGIGNFLSFDTLLGADSSYTKYLDDSRFDNASFSVGLGAIGTLVFNIYPLLFYERVVQRFPESKVYFIMFALGISINYVFAMNMLINRLGLFLAYTSIFVYPYLLQSLKDVKNFSYWFTLIIMNFWFAFLFYGTMSSFWANQTHLYPRVLGIPCY